MSAIQKEFMFAADRANTPREKERRRQTTAGVAPTCQPRQQWWKRSNLVAPPSSTARKVSYYSQLPIS